MKIHFASDTHYEMGFSTDYKPPKADVYIFAGDLTSYKNVIMTLKTLYGTDTPVIYIPGNHEYYFSSLKKVSAYLRRVFKEVDNFYYLNPGAVVINNVNFIGATLWTDFGLYGKHMAPMARLKAPDVINDYTYIEDFTPYKAQTAHRRHLNFIKKNMSKKKNVIITHHAPSIKSIMPKYQYNHIMNTNFASDLDYMFGKHIPLWIHGHMHDSINYERNGTSVLANPYGYHGENKQFDKNIIVEI